MAKSTNTCNSILKLIFNGTAWDDIAENDTTAPLASLYVSLHTGVVGVGDDQTVNEADYTAYDRLSVTRNAGGWLVAVGGVTKNTALAQFPEAAGGTNVITHVAIGTADLPGAGHVLYAGSLTAPRTITAGIQPQFAAEALVVTET